MHGEMLPCVIDVYFLILCGFSVWVLPYLTLRRRELFHCRAPNPAKHTKVEYKVPPRCLGYLSFLCMVIIHASSNLHPPNPNAPNSDPHNLSSKVQHLATQRPTLSMWIRLMPQGPPMEAP